MTGCHRADRYAFFQGISSDNPNILDALAIDKYYF